MRNYQSDKLKLRLRSALTSSEAEMLTQALLDDGIEIKRVETNIRMAKTALLNIVVFSPKTFEFLCEESPISEDLSMMIDDLERIAGFLNEKEKENDAIKIFESVKSVKSVAEIRPISWISRLENFFINTAWTSMFTALLLACGALGAYGLEQMKLSGLEVSERVDFEEATGQLGGASVTSFSIFFASAVCGAVAGSLKNKIDSGD